MKDKKLMIVTWRDHFGRTGWHDVEPVDLTPLKVETVGWLAGEDDDMIALSNSVTNDDRADYTITILKEAIISIEEIVF